MEAENLEEYPESGLVFRFSNTRLFKPDTASGKGLQGVKGCDFVWRKAPDKLFIVEVKSSAPRGGHDLQIYLEKVATQFLHGALLWLAALSGRHAERITLPEKLQGMEALQATPRLILVVNGLRKAHAGPLRDALQRHVGATCRAFAMEQPLVLDADSASRYFHVRPQQDACG